MAGAGRPGVTWAASEEGGIMQDPVHAGLQEPNPRELQVGLVEEASAGSWCLYPRQCGWTQARVPGPFLVTGGF